MNSFKFILFNLYEKYYYHLFQNISIQILFFVTFLEKEIKNLDYQVMVQ